MHLDYSSVSNLILVHCLPNRWRSTRPKTSRLATKVLSHLITADWTTWCERSQRADLSATHRLCPGQWCLAALLIVGLASVKIWARQVRLKVNYGSVATVCNLTITHGQYKWDFDRASDYFAYYSVVHIGHHAAIMFAFALANVITN